MWDGGVERLLQPVQRGRLEAGEDDVEVRSGAGSQDGEGGPAEATERREANLAVDDESRVLSAQLLDGRVERSEHGDAEQPDIVQRLAGGTLHHRARHLTAPDDHHLISRLFTTPEDERPHSSSTPANVAATCASEASTAWA